MYDGVTYHGCVWPGPRHRCWNTSDFRTRCGRDSSRWSTKPKIPHNLCGLHVVIGWCWDCQRGAAWESLEGKIIMIYIWYTQIMFFEVLVRVEIWCPFHILKLHVHWCPPINAHFSGCLSLTHHYCTSFRVRDTSRRSWPKVLKCQRVKLGCDITGDVTGRLVFYLYTVCIYIYYIFSVTVTPIFSAKFLHVTWKLVIWQGELLHKCRSMKNIAANLQPNFWVAH